MSGTVTSLCFSHPKTRTVLYVHPNYEWDHDYVPDGGNRIVLEIEGKRIALDESQCLALAKTLESYGKTGKLPAVEELFGNLNEIAKPLAAGQ